MNRSRQIPLDSPLFESPGGKVVSDIEKKICMNYLRPDVGMRILDIGTGTGRLAKELIDRGAEVVGLDLNVMQISQTSTGFQGISTARFHGIAGDCQHLPFRDSSFEAIVCFRVLKYVPDYRLAIAEMGRMLRPGGRLVLEISNLYSWEVLLQIIERAKGLNPTVLHFFRTKNVSKLLKQQNFEVISSAPTYKIPFFVWAHVRNRLALHVLSLFHRVLVAATPKEWLARGIILNCVLRDG